MSQYTTELRYLIKQGYNFELNEYPIFDESYRDVLNKKILDHYYYKEIGFETPQRFKHYLKTTLNEVMPYYNKLYLSELININPLYTVDYEETYTQTTEGQTISDNEAQQASTGTGTSTTASTADRTSNVDSLSVQDSTPAGLLSVADIKSNTWASSANREDSTNSETGTTSTDTNSTDETTASTIGKQKTVLNNAEEYIKKVQGNQSGSSASELLVKYRQSLINIDLQVISELKNLFMGVY